jgi:hypothetical protein
MAIEQDPFITISLGGGEKVRMTRENGTLYTFLGRSAVGDLDIDNTNFDHIFVQRGEGPEGGATGLYIFKAFQEHYKTIADFMIEQQFPMILNQRTIPLCDMEAYMREVDRTTANFAEQIPDFLD